MSTGESMRPRQTNIVPNTVPWLPLVYGAAALLAVGLGWLVPLNTWLPHGARPAGAVVMLIGLTLDGSAMLSMRCHHANILPHRAATALVTSWPFSVSRNPIYLGNTLMLAGAAVAFGNPWFAAMAATAVFVVTKLAIEREELHLATLFGSAWRDYAERVPRWLRLRP